VESVVVFFFLLLLLVVVLFSLLPSLISVPLW